MDRLGESDLYQNQSEDPSPTIINLYKVKRDRENSGSALGNALGDAPQTVLWPGIPKVARSIFTGCSN